MMLFSKLQHAIKIFLLHWGHVWHFILSMCQDVLFFCADFCTLVNSLLFLMMISLKLVRFAWARLDLNTLAFTYKTCKIEVRNDKMFLSLKRHIFLSISIAALSINIETCMLRVSLSFFCWIMKSLSKAGVKCRRVFHMMMHRKLANIFPCPRLCSGWMSASNVPCAAKFIIFVPFKISLNALWNIEFCPRMRRRSKNLLWSYYNQLLHLITQWMILFLIFVPNCL